MKKSLIALAVMAAAGAASAQSSVQLYGIADVWLGSTSTKVNGVKTDNSQNRMEDGGLSYSRFGLKGSEDLGNGLKANFVLEQGFNVDSGTDAFAGTSFGRQSTVGLSGGFGAVDFGRQATAYDDVFGLTNNTLDANVSVTYTVWDMHTFRANNTIKYTSPEFAGFSGGLSYSLGEDKVQNGTKAGSLVALGGKYVNGPLAVAAGFQQEKGGAAVGTLLGGKALVAGEKSTHTLLGASYDLGVVKLLAGFSQAKYEDGVDTDKTSQYQLGVDVPLASNLVLTGGYAKSKSKFNGVEYGKSSGFNAALVYSLSKRTSVYAALVNAKAEDVPQTTEVKANVYAVGVKHAF